MQVTFLPKQISMDCAPHEAVYDAANRQGIRLPVACRNGVCCICKARLITGVVKEKQLIKQSNEVQEEVLLCKAVPQTDCEFEIENVFAPGELPVNKVTCQVIDVSVLKGAVYRVLLRLPAGKLIEFYPGQYLSLLLPEKKDANYYSIASCPGQREIELHIQADAHLTTAVEVISFLQSNTLVQIEMPFGKACLTDIPTKPLILIAAGTGFAQMKSIVEYLQSVGNQMPLALYWGVRQKSDLYHLDLVTQWQKDCPNISITSVFSELGESQGVEHHHRLAKAVMMDHEDFSQSLVFVSGSPKLVFTLMDDLVAAGLPESQFFSDVLEYASRPE